MVTGYEITRGSSRGAAAVPQCFSIHDHRQGGPNSSQTASENLVDAYQEQKGK